MISDFMTFSYGIFNISSAIFKRDREKRPNAAGVSKRDIIGNL